MPVHGEGSSMWKELGALEDIVMMSQSNARMFREAHSAADIDEDGPGLSVVIKPLKLFMTMSQNAPTKHTHEIHLTAEQVEKLKNGEQVSTFSTTEVGHQHLVRLRFNNDMKSATYGYLITECGNNAVTTGYACADRHGRMVVPINQ